MTRELQTNVNTLVWNWAGTGKQRRIGISSLADWRFLARRGAPAAPSGGQVLGKVTWARPASTQQL